MIGTLEQLRQKASGVNPTVKPNMPSIQSRSNLSGIDVSEQFDVERTMGNDPWRQALGRMSEFGSTPKDWALSYATTGSPGTSALSGGITDLYGQLLGGVQRSSGGLSSTGKYGGFFSSEDLKNAIIGTSQKFRGTADDLRRMAFERYADVRTQYNSPRQRYEKELLSGYQNAPDPEYWDKARSWAIEATKPAEEYLKTAQQIQATPMSTLATQIASRVYGMNPDLAAGKFANLDQTLYGNRLDAESISKTGMPYAEYKSFVEQQKSASEEQQKQTQDSYKSELGAITGLDPNVITRKTGRTAEQLLQTYYSNEESKNYIDNAIAAIAQEDFQQAFNLANEAAAADRQDIRQLILALAGIVGSGSSTVTNQLIENYGVKSE